MCVGAEGGWVKLFFDQVCGGKLTSKGFMENIRKGYNEINKGDIWRNW